VERRRHEKRCGTGAVEIFTPDLWSRLYYP
jgi:hypothetical protein